MNIRRSAALYQGSVKVAEETKCIAWVTRVTEAMDQKASQTIVVANGMEPVETNP